MLKEISISLALFLVIGISQTCAQDKPTLDELLLPAKTKIIRAPDEPSVQEAHALLEKARVLFPEEAMPAYWEGFADYRLTVFYNRIQNTVDAQKFAKHGVAALEKAIVLDPNSSESYALLATLEGMLIQYDPMSGPILGPRASGHFQKAIALNDQNPRAYFLKAISTLFKPKMYGGGAEYALVDFQKALKLFESESQTDFSNTVHPDWGRLDCHVFYAQALLQTGEPEKARSTLEAALKIDPNHRFAKYSLEKLTAD